MFTKMCELIRKRIIKLLKAQPIEEVRTDISEAARISRESFNLADQLAREKTQAAPLEIPEAPGAFWIKVKVDHEGVFRSNHSDYVYEAVKLKLDEGISTYIEWVEKLSPITNGDIITNITKNIVNEIEPYWLNYMFENNDARICYAMVAALKPKRIIEVGSGHSTKFMRRALKDYGIDCNLIAIDPYPRSEIDNVATTVIRESVWDVDLNIFDALEPGDIFFWDGSHITFNGTDTTHFYLNILPRIRSGVYVHVHDIQLPNEYDSGYSAHYYNEQYMLATLILNSSKWRPLLPLHYIGTNMNPNLLGRSFWMQHVH